MAESTGCKVDRVIERYGLETADPRYDHIDEGLLARWTGDDSLDAVGYRSLTAWFNKRLLRRVFDRHGRDALAGRVDSDYDALTSDDDLVRREAIESLDADGIDGEGVAGDLVSWGTMRTHLNECLGGSKERPDREGESDWERESVAMAQSFVSEKVESALSSLSTKGELDGVDASSVSVQVQLRCDHCPTRVPFDVALERGYVCNDHAAGARTNS